MEVAISGDRNVIKNEAEKILKYKDLTIEIQRMWNVETKVIPVIIGATGTISILCLTTDPIHQGHEKRKKSVTSAPSPRNTSAQLRDR